jgi:hypothetical protein
MVSLLFLFSRFGWIVCYLALRLLRYIPRAHPLRR